MARTKMTKGKRDESVRVYLNEDEKKRIEDKAAVAGLSAAAYLRQLALADLAKDVEANKAQG
jgi:predicted DNA binding CopG/RHH family protein